MNRSVIFHLGVVVILHFDSKVIRIEDEYYS
jgi:hypothetical protein